MLSEARRFNLRNWFSALRRYLPALLTPDGLDDLQILGVARGTVRHVFPICGFQGFDPIWHSCQLLERRPPRTTNPLRVGIVAQYRCLEHALHPAGLFFGGLRHKDSVYVTDSRAFAFEPAGVAGVSTAQTSSRRCCFCDEAADRSPPTSSRPGGAR